MLSWKEVILRRKRGWTSVSQEEALSFKGWQRSASSSVTACLSPGDREDGESELWGTLGQSHIVWQGQCSHLSTPETLPLPNPRCISTGGSGGAQQGWGSAMVGAKSEKHMGWCLGRRQWQPSSVDTRVSASSARETAAKCPHRTHQVCGDGRVAEGGKSVNIYLKNVHNV